MLACLPKLCAIQLPHTPLLTPAGCPLLSLSCCPSPSLRACPWQVYNSIRGSKALVLEKGKSLDCCGPELQAKVEALKGKIVSEDYDPSAAAFFAGRLGMKHGPAAGLVFKGGKTGSPDVPTIARWV